MTFKQDFRVSNPKLHELYVGWAMSHLRIANDYIEEMEGFSNYNAGLLCDGVRSAIKELIDDNAAYHDAAARLFAGQEPPPYHEDPPVAEEAIDLGLSAESPTEEPPKVFVADYSAIEARVLSYILSGGVLDPLNGMPVVNAKGLEPGAYFLEKVPSGWYARKATAEGNHEVGAGNPFDHLIGKSFKVRVKDGKVEDLEFEDVAIPAEPAIKEEPPKMVPLDPRILGLAMREVFGPDFGNIPVVIRFR